MNHSSYLTTTDVFSGIFWLWITTLAVSCAPSTSSLNLPPPNTADGTTTTQLTAAQLEEQRQQLAALRRELDNAKKISDLTCLTEEVRHQWGDNPATALANCTTGPDFEKLTQSLKTFINTNCKGSYQSQQPPAIDLGALGVSFVSSLIDKDGRKSIGQNLNDAFQKQQELATTSRKEYNAAVLQESTQWITCKSDNTQTALTHMYDGWKVTEEAKIEAEKICRTTINDLFKQPVCSEDGEDPVTKEDEPKDEPDDNLGGGRTPSEGQGQ